VKISHKVLGEWATFLTYTVYQQDLIVNLKQYRKMIYKNIEFKLT